MDPLTQSLLGAVAVQAAFTGRVGRAAVLLGMVGGELADIDVVMGGLADPALPFEWHRHFTHSLIFIPIGGAIAALPFYLFRKFREKPWLTYAATTLAYATHGLLDNCTSYGTHLLWPFVSERTAFDCMSIIDPIFTGLLIVAVLLSLVLGRAKPAVIGLSLALAYIGAGFVQHARAMSIQEQLAGERGHEPAGGRVMPTIGNIVLWRSVYEHDGRLYADGIRLSPFNGPKIKEGRSVPRFTADELPTGGTDPERVRRVFLGFESFASDFMAPTAREGPGRVTLGDMRYSMDTAGFSPIWGLRIDADADDPVRWANYRAEDPDPLGSMWEEIIGADPAYR
jgi:inner membrane protein